jgi:hypothetical protein
MTYVAPAAAFADAVEIEFELPVASPEMAAAVWARRNPARAMALLYVDPREGAVLDEVLAH